MTTAHTATPWGLEQYSKCEFDIYGARNGVTEVVATVEEVDARFIVSACNAHDDLVKALKWAEAYIKEVESRHEYGGAYGLPMVAAALAKAGAA